jgi:hypothetical protein
MSERETYLWGMGSLGGGAIMKTTIKRVATADGWSEDIRWRDIWRAHVVTGLHETKHGSSKLRRLIEKQIAKGKVRQTAKGTYQFRTGM